MAHLQRLILAAVFAVVSFSAHALIPMGNAQGYWSRSASPAEQYPSMQAACQAYVGALQQMFTNPRYSFVLTSCTATGSNKGSAVVSRYLDGAFFDTFSDGNYYVAGAPQCPANSTPSGTQCQCAATYIEDPTHTSCIPKPDECVQLAGKSAGSKNWNGVQDSFTFCDGWNDLGGGKCTATAFKSLSWEDPPGSGKWMSQGDAVYTGSRASSCNGTGGSGSDPAGSTPTPDKNPPSKPAPGEAAPAPCPPGQAAGDFNGSRICAPVGSDVPKSGQDSTTTKNPDGSTTKTDTKTECTGINCTVTKTDCTTAAGAASADCKTTTTTSGQSGFCDKNKGNKVCQGQGEGTPTSFSGTCASGFTAVSDDAVINAMAAETFRQNCKVNPDDGETTLAKTERAKTGNQTGDNPNNDKVSISSGAIDTSDALGGAAMCIGDKTINVMGLSPVTIPFSRWCDGFPLLGNLMLACSFLLAGVIILRR